MSEAETQLVRARLREISAEIKTLHGEGARVLYRLGLLIREVEDEAHWRQTHDSFYDWVEDNGVARSTAHRAVNVVRNFNLDIAVRYGFDKLYQGLRYLELTRNVEQPGDLIAAELRLRGADGRFTSVGFHEASVRQIQDAIAVLVESRSARPRLEDGLDSKLHRLNKALPQPPAGLRAKERVVATRARDGSIALTFRQIPLAELDAFLAAVKAELGE